MGFTTSIFRVGTTMGTRIRAVYGLCSVRGLERLQRIPGGEIQPDRADFIAIRDLCRLDRAAHPRKEKGPLSGASEPDKRDLLRLGARCIGEEPDFPGQINLQSGRQDSYREMAYSGVGESRRCQNLQVHSKAHLSIVAGGRPSSPSICRMTDASTRGDFRGLFNRYTSAPRPPRAPFFWVV